MVDLTALVPAAASVPLGAGIAASRKIARIACDHPILITGFIFVSATAIHSRRVKFHPPALAEGHNIHESAPVHLRPENDPNAAAPRHIGGSPHKES